MVVRLAGRADRQVRGRARESAPRVPVGQVGVRRTGAGPWNARSHPVPRDPAGGGWSGERGGPQASGGGFFAEASTRRQAGGQLAAAQTVRQRLVAVALRGLIDTGGPPPLSLASPPCLTSLAEERRRRPSIPPGNRRLQPAARAAGCPGRRSGRLCGAGWPSDGIEVTQRLPV